MKWKKFKIKTRTEAEDIIISTLYAVSYTHLDVYKRQASYLCWKNSFR